MADAAAMIERCFRHQQTPITLPLEVILADASRWEVGPPQADALAPADSGYRDAVPWSCEDVAS